MDAKPSEGLAVTSLVISDPNGFLVKAALEVFVLFLCLLSKNNRYLY